MTTDSNYASCYRASTCALLLGILGGASLPGSSFAGGPPIIEPARSTGSYFCKAEIERDEGVFDTDLLLDGNGCKADHVEIRPVFGGGFLIEGEAHSQVELTTEYAEVIDGLFAGPGPGARVEVSAERVGILNSADGQGEATAEVFVAIALIEPPPLDVTFIPLIFTVPWELRVDGIGSGAGGSIIIDHPAGDPLTELFTPDLAGASLPDNFGEESGELELQFPLLLNQAVRLQVRASCVVIARRTNSSVGSCRADLKGRVRFDQAAVDEALGVDTVQLEDYFEITTSPDLFTVPEPRFSHWAAFATVGLLASRRARGARLFQERSWS